MALLIHPLSLVQKGNHHHTMMMLMMIISCSFYRGCHWPLGNKKHLYIKYLLVLNIWHVVCVLFTNVISIWFLLCNLGHYDWARTTADRNTTCSQHVKHQVLWLWKMSFPSLHTELGPMWMVICKLGTNVHGLVLNRLHYNKTRNIPVDKGVGNYRDDQP